MRAFVQPTDENWRLRAACRNLDPDTFYPFVGQVAEVNRAKRICEGCPVRQECLDYAMYTRQRHGVWGGMSERERRRLRIKRREAARAG